MSLSQGTLANASVQCSLKAEDPLKQISEELSRREKGLAILAIKRKTGGTVTNPTGDILIQSGDHLIVMGTRTQIDQFQKDYGVKGTD